MRPKKYIVVTYKFFADISRLDLDRYSYINNRIIMNAYDCIVNKVNLTNCHRRNEKYNNH